MTLGKTLEDSIVSNLRRASELSRLHLPHEASHIYSFGSEPWLTHTLRKLVLLYAAGISRQLVYRGQTRGCQRKRYLSQSLFVRGAIFIAPCGRLTILCCTFALSVDDVGLGTRHSRSTESSQLAHRLAR